MSGESATVDATWDALKERVSGYEPKTAATLVMFYEAQAIKCRMLAEESERILDLLRDRPADELVKAEDLVDLVKADAERRAAQ